MATSIIVFWESSLQLHFREENSSGLSTLIDSVITLDLGGLEEQIEAQLEDQGAVNPTVTKTEDSITLSWEGGTIPIWAIGDPAPTEIPIQAPDFYQSVQVFGMIGKKIEVTRTANSITIDFSALESGSITRTATPQSLRTFRVVAHGLSDGDPVAFFNGDSLVATSRVSKVTDVDYFSVPLRDVPDADLQVTHIGDPATLDHVDTGSKVVPAEITKSFYIPTVTPDIDTFFDIPTIQGGDTAQAQLDALVADHVNKMPIGPSELQQISAGMYMRTVTQIKIEDVMRTGWIAPPPPDDPDPDPDPEWEGALDGVTPFAAWGLHALYSDYDGPLIRVKRLSDNVEVDISANPLTGKLDQSALLAHCDGGDGIITVFYDQTGSNYNLIGATGPIIVSSGVVQSVDGSPSAVYDGTARNLTVEIGSPDGLTSMTMLAICAPTPGAPTANYGGRAVLHMHESNSWGSCFLSTFPEFIRMRFGYGSASADRQHSRVQASPELEVIASEFTGTHDRIWLNGLNVVSASRTNAISRTIGFLDVGHAESASYGQYSFAGAVIWKEAAGLVIPTITPKLQSTFLF